MCGINLQIFFETCIQILRLLYAMDEIGKAVIVGFFFFGRLLVAALLVSQCFDEKRGELLRDL